MTREGLACLSAGEMSLNKKDRVDAAVVFWVVCDLGVLWDVLDEFCQRTLTRPDDLSASGDHTQLGDVDLDNGTLGEDTERGV